MDNEYAVQLTQAFVEDGFLHPGDIVTIGEDRFVDVPTSTKTNESKQVFQKDGRYYVVNMFPDYPGGFVVTTELSKGMFTGKQKKTKNTALIHFGSGGSGELFKKIMGEKEYQEYQQQLEWTKKRLQEKQEEHDQTAISEQQQLVTQIALDLAHYLLYFIGDGGEATRKELIGVAWKRSQSMPIVGAALKMIGDAGGYYMDQGGKFVAVQKDLEKFIGHYSNNSNYEGPRLDYPGVESSLKFGGDDTPKPIEGTLWEEYDTIIFDLDETIWDVVSESGERMSAADVIPPLVLMDKDIILDSKNNTIRLQFYIRELFEILDYHMKNLGIVSRAELLNRPFESQPAIMALKKFDLFGYFNYEVILKRGMDKEEYVKPLGKTLFIDNDRETLQNVDISCCGDVMWRGSFNHWPDTMLPQKDKVV